MRILPLLGRQLKADEIIDLLESLEMEVIYDFDRLHEGQPDRYWAASKEAGLQLDFDEAQALETVFLHVTPDDDYEAFAVEESDIPIFSTLAEAQSVGDSQRLRVAKGCSDFLGITRDWVKFSFAAHSVHYEFRDGKLALITVSRS